MLNFDKNHVGADLSQIKEKLNKLIDSTGFVIGVVTLSSVLITGGIYVTGNAIKEHSADAAEISTVVIVNNDNALLVDFVEDGKYGLNARSFKTTSDDTIIVNDDNCTIVEGENSHEKAEEIARSLVGEDGQITYYDEAETYSKNR